jgi:hypothetical protein
MSTSQRRVLYSLLILLLVAFLCTFLVVLGGVGSLFIHPAATLAPTPVAQVSPTSLVVATSVTPVTPTGTLPVSDPTALASPSQPEIQPTPTNLPISPEIAQSMDEIQQQVIAIRGLQPSGPVERALLTPDLLLQKVNTEFFKSYTAQDAKNDEIILGAFGLLPSGFDLYAFTKSVYAEQISGFYDNETKQMYVVAGQGFKGPERMTYAHEYTHVLQDQNYGIRDGLQYSTEKCKETSERCAGIQALIEGDATVVEQDWLRTSSTDSDRQELQQFYQNYSSPVLDSAPAYMQQDMLFAYRSGQEFVQSLIDRGGWAAVNQAYNNPPLSTEQILHPDKYPDDKPVAVNLPDISSALGSGWSQVRSDVLGEWYTYLMLADGDDPKARLGDTMAQNASAGWGGDRFTVWMNDQTHQSALVLLSTWDTENDARQFAEAFNAYAEDRWGNPTNPDGALHWESGGRVNDFRSAGSQTLWVSAPDASTTQAILNLIPLQ